MPTAHIKHRKNELRVCL